MTTVALAVRYAAFAVLATLGNLAAQRVVLALYDGPHPLVPAILVGTGVGLVVKFVLDKRWIFADPGRGLSTHGRKLGLYTLTGVITTMIFWGTEATFEAIWRSDPMRELGAALGLAVGYILKYRLDKRYVFAPRLASGGVT